jgi:hypothetical protein
MWLTTTNEVRVIGEDGEHEDQERIDRGGETIRKDWEEVASGSD